MRPKRAAAASWSRVLALVSDRARAVPHPPGFSPSTTTPVCSAARARRAVHQGRPRHQHASRQRQDLIDAGILFCGTPDQVYAQIVDFTEYCGGHGQPVMMGMPASSLTRTMSNLSCFSQARDAQAQAYKQPVPEATAA